jgi:heme A synthase
VATADRTPSIERIALERSPLFSAIIGLASLGVLLQGVWAGLFFGDSGNHDLWVRVHQIGGMVTGALALVAAIVALAQLRHRRGVVVGAIVFFVLVVAEIGLGEALGDQRGLAAVHIPLAMALMGLAVWLPLRAARRG